MSTEWRKKKTMQCKLETYWRKQSQTADLWPDYDIITVTWRNHYSYDVIRVTLSSTNLYYFIIKCSLFIKILQCGKNTKNMKFLQNYKFPKIFRWFQQNSHCWTSKSCRTLKISQNMSNRYKPKVTKTQPAPVSEIFQKVLVGAGEGLVLFYPPGVNIGLNNAPFNAPFIWIVPVCRTF